MRQPQSITSVPESPEDERRRRMIRYATAMGIRVACVIACFFVHGWWLLVPVVGAVALPYVAVVLANVGRRTGEGVERPGAIVVSGAPREVDE
jgi:hypothetical protein